MGLKETKKIIPILDEILEETTAFNLEEEYLEGLLTKAIAKENLLDRQQSQKLINQGLEYIKKNQIGNKKKFVLIKAKFYSQKATNYYQTGNNKNSMIFARKALSIFERFNDSFGIAIMLTLIGLNYRVKGNYMKSVEFLNESLALFQEMNNDYQSAIIYHYLSRAYTSRGELNQAYDYMMKSLPIILEFGDDYRISVTLLHLIPILIEMGEYERAKDFSVQCLELIKKQGYIEAIGIVYYRLIRIALYQEDYDEAKRNLNILFSLRQKYSNPNYYVEFYQLAQALILISSDQLADLSKTESIFRELIAKEDLIPELKFESMCSLSELLIQEYQHTMNIEILKEVDTLSKSVLDYSKKEELAGFRIKAYVIRLLLLFVQEQAKEEPINQNVVENLISEANEIAKKLGLKTTTMHFYHQYLKLKNQKKIFNEFIQNYYSN